jgi:hypothetical protein
MYRTFNMENRIEYNRNTAHMHCTNEVRQVTGVTGTHSQSLRKYLSNIPGKQDINELQKTPILSTARTRTSKRINVKVQNVDHGKNHDM